MAGPGAVTSDIKGRLHVYSSVLRPLGLARELLERRGPLDNVLPLPPETVMHHFCKRPPDFVVMVFMHGTFLLFSSSVAITIQ